MDFSETFAACDLKFGRCRQLIEIMKVLKVKVISLPYIFQVLHVLCFTRSRYQVSVYRTNGPLVSNNDPRVTLTYCTARSNLVTWLFYGKK